MRRAGCFVHLAPQASVEEAQKKGRRLAAYLNVPPLPRNRCQVLPHPHHAHCSPCPKHSQRTRYPGPQPRPPALANPCHVHALAWFLVGGRGGLHRGIRSPGNLHPTHTRSWGSELAAFPSFGSIMGTLPLTSESSYHVNTVSKGKPRAPNS